MFIEMCKLWGFQGGDNKDYRPFVPTFRRQHALFIFRTQYPSRTSQPVYQCTRHTPQDSTLHVFKQLVSLYFLSINIFEDRLLVETLINALCIILTMICVYTYIQDPPKKCIHILTKENSMLYNRLL